MILTQVTNESSYTKRRLPARLDYWWRRAYDMRSRQLGAVSAISEAAIDTFLQGKGLSSAEITDILSNIAD